MNKPLLIIAIVLVLILGYRILAEYNQTRDENYRKQYETYRRDTSGKLAERFDELSSRIGELGYRGGSTGQFEGPQAHIELLKFHDEILNRSDGERLFFDGNTLNFDPDHPFYGLPNLVASVGPVKLYEPEGGKLSQLLRIAAGSREPKPYKIYKKRVRSAHPNAPVRSFEMQLWLTEFEVTVGIVPERNDPAVPPTREERERTSYPGYWYGSSRNQVKLGDLKEEWKNNRYGNVTLVLKIIPNNAPWYVKTALEQNERPDIAIGAVYCSDLVLSREQDEQRISPNIQKGSVIFLRPESGSGAPEEQSVKFPDDLSSAAQKVFDETVGGSSGSAPSIWNKPFYIKIFFNNIGSWKEGWFLNWRKFDDQVTFRFLMPVFVVGSWDVIVPGEIIPKWEPPKPYYDEFTLGSLFPSWGLGFLGKLFSGGALVVVLIVILALLFPSVLSLVNAVIGRIAVIIRPRR
jgi:hypothetical protein